MFKKLFPISLLIFAVPSVAYANVVIDPMSQVFGIVAMNVFLVVIVTIIEAIVIKFGLRLRAWHALYSTFLANLFTTVFGWMFFKRILFDFHSIKIDFESVIFILLIFAANLLMEFAILTFLIKLPPKKIMLYAFIANLITYAGLLILINIPYIL